MAGFLMPTAQLEQLQRLDFDSHVTALMTPPEPPPPPEPSAADLAAFDQHVTQLLPKQDDFGPTLDYSPDWTPTMPSAPPRQGFGQAQPPLGITTSSGLNENYGPGIYNGQMLPGAGGAGSETPAPPDVSPSPTPSEVAAPAPASLPPMSATPTLTTPQSMQPPAGGQVVPSNQGGRDAFKQSFAPYAQYAAERLGIDPSIVTAMAISESGGGNIPGNSFFGMKGSPFASGSISLPTWELVNGQRVNINDNFATFSTPKDAVDAWIDFLQKHTPGVFGAKTPEEFAAGLKAGGYMTDTADHYAATLRNLGATPGGTGTPSGAVTTPPVPASGGGGGLADSIGGAAQAASGAVQGMVQPAVTAIGQGFSDIGSGAQDMVSQFDQHVHDATNGVIDLRSKPSESPVQPQQPSLAPSQPISVIPAATPPQQSVWDQIGTGISNVFKSAFGGGAEVLGGTVGGAIGGPAGATIGAQAGHEAAQFATGPGAEAAGKFLTEPLPGTQNLVGAGLVRSQAALGMYNTRGEPVQPLTPQEQYAEARGLASGLASTLQPDAGAFGSAVGLGQKAAAVIEPAAADVARTAAQVLPRFATTVGGAVAGGAAGNATTPDTANPFERGARIAGGAVLGGTLGYGGGALLERGAGAGEAVPMADIVKPSAMHPEVPVRLPVDVPHGLTVTLAKYPEEVQTVIKAAYGADPATMDVARRGVIPDAVVQQLADLTGTKVSQIVSRWQPGQAANAETIYALRRALATEGTKVVEAQAALKADPTSVDAMHAMVTALTNEHAVQEVVTGVTAESGRAQRQFRMAVSPLDKAEQAAQMITRLAGRLKMPPQELATHLAGLDLTDPVAVASLARNLQKVTFPDKVSAYWYFSLLSSPLTHIRNIVSNALTTIVSPLETGGGAAIDLARVGVTRALGGKASREIFLGEVPAEFVGQFAGLREGTTQGLQILKHGFSNAQAAGQLAGTGGVLKEPLGPIIAMPGRMLGAEDAFFRTANQTGALYGIAYREASQAGFKGRDLIDATAMLVKSPSPQMLEEAQRIGTYRVFQEDGSITQAVGKALNAIPGSRFIVPFYRTPINIAKFALERTPAGLIGLGLKARSGTLTTREAEMAFARMGMGSAVMGYLYTQAAGGNMTGAAPQSPAERDAFFRDGKQAYSVRVGGTWYSYQALQPYSTLFAAAAAIHDAQQKGITKEPWAAGVLVAGTVAKSLTDMPWTQGLTNALEFFQDPAKMAGTYAEHQATSIVPAAIRWMARATDGMLRDPSGPVEAVLANIPGASASVPARQDAFGNNVTRPAEQMGAGSLNPLSPTPAKDDPVEKAMLDLQLRGFQVEPGFVGQVQTVLGQQVQLTPGQQRQKQQVAGSLAYALLLPIVTDPAWPEISDEGRRRIITGVIGRTRDYADKQLLPELVGSAREGIQRQEETGIRRPAPLMMQAPPEEDQTATAPPVRLPAFSAPVRR